MRLRSACVVALSSALVLALAPRPRRVGIEDYTSPALITFNTTRCSTLAPHLYLLPLGVTPVGTVGYPCLLTMLVKLLCPALSSRPRPGPGGLDRRDKDPEHFTHLAITLNLIPCSHPRCLPLVFLLPFLLLMLVTSLI